MSAGEARRRGLPEESSMTVGELIAMLEDCDEEAEVRIMSQEGWPFENAIRGVAVREDFPSDDCECDRRIEEPHEEGCPAQDDVVPEGCLFSDVFIVEGDQERYGNKAAWEACRRSRRLDLIPSTEDAATGPRFSLLVFSPK